MTAMTEAVPRPAACNTPPTPRALARRRQLTLVVAIAALWIARGFLAPLAWAVVLAIAEWPMHRWLQRHWGKRNGLIALVLTLGTALLVLLPLGLVAGSLVGESQAAIAWVQGVQQHGLPPPQWLGGLPLIGAKATEAWSPASRQPASGEPRCSAGSAPGRCSAGCARRRARSQANRGCSSSRSWRSPRCSRAGEGLARQTRTVASRMLGEFGGRFVERLDRLRCARR